MDLRDIRQCLEGRTPIEDIPLNWDATVYTSADFNRSVSAEDFTGWPGERPTDQEVRVIAQLLDVHAGSCLLDVACGYGRHAQLLGRDYGASVTGVDISPGLIAKATELAAQAQVHVDYHVMDARRMSFEDAFDGVFVAFNSFSLFSPDDAPAVLANIHRALRPAGRLFLDLDNRPFNCRYGADDVSWETIPGGLKLQEVHFHADVSVEVCRDISFIVSSPPIEAVMFKRLYARDEICSLLSQCGFDTSQLYGDWDLSPLDEDSPKIILLATRG